MCKALTYQTEQEGEEVVEAKEKMSKKQKMKVLLFVTEIGIILVMLAVLYIVMNKSSEGPKMVQMNPEVLEIHEEVQQQTQEGGVMHGYMNIALFGLDAETENQLYKGSRSDSTMIASINLDTGEIRLVSVYRDTYLNLGTDYYWKCNAAYSYGGAEQAVKMLNMNLDMDITDFVAVGYQGLASVIDGLGGVYIDLDSEEVDHLNNYQIGVSSVLKCEYEPVKESGYQLLNGVQAVAYCRIRATKGDDFKRTARQRKVIKAIEEQAKKTDLVTLTKVFNDSIDSIYTSIDAKDILELLGSIADYSIVEEEGFPQPDLRTVGNIGGKGSCVVPLDLESNVVWLHKFLFDDEDYSVTESVKEYGRQIQAETSPYLPRQ